VDKNSDGGIVYEDTVSVYHDAKVSQAKIRWVIAIVSLRITPDSYRLNVITQFEHDYDVKS
jgi:hypothetical protein